MDGSVPCGEVLTVELAQLVVTTGASQNFQQFGACLKEVLKRLADLAISSRFRKSSRCVAIPTGQLFVSQARMVMHPIACIAALETGDPVGTEKRVPRRSLAPSVVRP
jgi:hypothetical protein